jgi:hypothetical protein
LVVRERLNIRKRAEVEERDIHDEVRRERVEIDGAEGNLDQ